MYTQSLENNLKQNKYSINMCWINELNIFLSVGGQRMCPFQHFGKMSRLSSENVVQSSLPPTHKPGNECWCCSLALQKSWLLSWWGGPAEEGGILGNNMFQSTEAWRSLHQPLASCVTLDKFVLLIHKTGTKTTGLPNIVSIQWGNTCERPWKSSNTKAALLLTKRWGGLFMHPA